MAKENTRSMRLVSNINDEKGCGFIEREDGTDDLFVHPSEIGSEAYRPAVEFMVASENDKTKARDVTGCNGDPVDPVGGGDWGDFGGWKSGDGGGNDNDNGDGDVSGVLGFSDDIGRIVNGGGAECRNSGGNGHKDEECDREASGARGGGMGGGRCVHCGGCDYCGNPGHSASECDSEYFIVDGNVVCGYCGVLGHIASNCDCYIKPRACIAAESGHM